MPIPNIDNDDAQTLDVDPCWRDDGGGSLAMPRLQMQLDRFTAGYRRRCDSKQKWQKSVSEYAGKVLKHMNNCI